MAINKKMIAYSLNAPFLSGIEGPPVFSKSLPDSFEIFEWATFYVSQGLSVIPLNIKDKTPLRPWGDYQKRLPAIEELKEWFPLGTKRNIGIVTGKLSGINVIDCDTLEAYEAAMDRKAAFFPPLVKTARGFHLFCKATPGATNFQSRKDLEKVDFRGEGGYVVAPPSIHASGVQYQWVPDSDCLTLPELPSWVLGNPQKEKTHKQQLLDGVSEGGRNNALASLAGQWFREGKTLADVLIIANGWNLKNNPPMEEDEVDKTVRSIFKRHEADQEGSTKVIAQGPLPLHEVKPGDDETTIQHLVALSPLQYDRERKGMADSLGVRSATLDKMVQAARKGEEADTGLIFNDLEPWSNPVNGATLLAEIADTVRRFIICQPETAHAVALWAAMTWFMNVVQVAPLAVITAPEKRCGKSQLLFLLGRLVYRPLTASNISTAALFRTIDAWRPTMLVDEADSFMKENEDMRGLLNSGHTRDGAYIIRVVGDDHEPKRFNTWGAKALAGIGRIADTLMDRAVVLELRRKLPHEQVERLRYAEPDLFETLAEKLCRFAEDHQEAVRKARPDLPAKLNDRAQDNWEPLLAIADIAGGQWPSLARAAALKLSGSSDSTLTIGVELLSDIQEMFEAKRVDRISTAELIAFLCQDEEKPWATYNRGFPIKPRQVARKLSEYGIKSTTIRIPHSTAKGYKLDQFTETFSRYLVFPPSPSVTPSQPTPDGLLCVTDRGSVP